MQMWTPGYPSDEGANMEEKAARRTWSSWCWQRKVLRMGHHSPYSPSAWSYLNSFRITSYTQHNHINILSFFLWERNFSRSSSGFGKKIYIMQISIQWYWTNTLCTFGLKAIQKIIVPMWIHCDKIRLTFSPILKNPHPTSLTLQQYITKGVLHKLKLTNRPIQAYTLFARS